MVRLWVLNTLPSHWDRCRDGPTDGEHHPDRHLGHPWHGIPTGGRAPDPETLIPGEDLFLVRQTGGIGVSGIWTFEEARRVRSQDAVPEVWRNHDGNVREYDWFLYCRGTPELSLSPPMREDFTGDFPFHHSKLTGTGIEMDDEGCEAYVAALARHGVSRTTQRRVREALETDIEYGPRSGDYEPPDRTEYVTTRPIRDTKVSEMAKELYDHRCQLCGDRRQSRDGSPYAEAHHVKPLGDPHGGPDTADNVVVLCPNHHADFDYGRLRIDPETREVTHVFDKAVDGTKLRLSSDHVLNAEFLTYHNERIAEF
ncbi:MAG: HNH endonuclease [Halolamina sp.]